MNKQTKEVVCCIIGSFYPCFYSYVAKPQTDTKKKISARKALISLIFLDSELSTGQLNLKILI